jgi:enoyl-CoA hydratase
MSDYAHIRIEVGDDRIATVWLDRPPVNAFNQQMYRDLKAAFEEVGAREDVNIVVLATAGRHFCGGNDLDEFKTLSPENSPERMLEVIDAFRAIYDCPVPVLAALRGVAFGAGAGIVGSCDFTVAAHGAKLGLPEIGVGVMGGARHLARLVPQAYMRVMFFTGEPAAVEELERFGGIIEIVDPDQLMDRARHHALLVARHSPVAIRTAKRALNESEFMDLFPGYEAEQRYTGELSGHPDSKEALNAFLERRPPRYAGA